MKNQFYNAACFLVLLVCIFSLGLLSGCASEGNTSLIDAAKKGNASRVKYLLARQSNVDALNDSVNTALAKAIHAYKREVERTADEKKIKNYQKTIRMLVDAGADINFRKNDGDTLLYMMISYFDPGRNEKQQIEALKFLMDMGANPNLMKPGYSPLTNAIQKPRAYLAKVLLDNGADPWMLPEDFSSGHPEYHLLFLAKLWKRDKLYDLLYPYMKNRFEATNKTLADSAKTFMKACLSSDVDTIKSVTLKPPHKVGNRWLHWSKEINEIYTGNEDLLKEIRVGWFAIDGFADVFVPLPKGMKAKCIHLGLFLHPDGTWKCMDFNELNILPKSEDPLFHCTGYYLKKFKNFIYDQHGLTDKLNIEGGSSNTSKGECVTGRLIFKVQKDGLRIDKDDGYWKKQWYVLTPKYVKSYSEQELDIKGKIRLLQKDGKMEVTYEPARCAIEREGRKYVFTFEDGKVKLDDGKEVVLAEKIVVKMPEVVIETN